LTCGNSSVVFIARLAQFQQREILPDTADDSLD
jgi:hypothetical protein